MPDKKMPQETAAKRQAKTKRLLDKVEEIKFTFGTLSKERFGCQGMPPLQ